MKAANKAEWAEIGALLTRAHALHPELTIGEVVWNASKISGSADPWDALPGAVGRGLKIMIGDDPDQITAATRKIKGPREASPRVLGATSWNT